MEFEDKAKEDSKYVDFNQIVNELLTISSHNISEIPSMHQSRDAPKEAEPSAAKEAARGNAEKKGEIKRTTEQKKEPQVPSFSSYCIPAAKCSRHAA